MPKASPKKAYKRRYKPKPDKRIAEQVDKSRRIQRRINEQEIRLVSLERTMAILLDELRERLSPTAAFGPEDRISILTPTESFERSEPDDATEA